MTYLVILFLKENGGIKGRGKSNAGSHWPRTCRGSMASAGFTFVEGGSVPKKLVSQNRSAADFSGLFALTPVSE